MKPVAIFAATRWELRALHRAFPTARAATLAGLRCFADERAGHSYRLIQTGVGPESAARVAKTVMDAHAMESIISAGFACALVPAQVGDLMIGTQSISARSEDHWKVQGDVVSCDEVLKEQMRALAWEAGLPVRTGRFVSVPIVVGQAQEKRCLSQAADAVALDMESQALGAVAWQRGVPFAIVRTVSDLLDEDLPLDFNQFLRPFGWPKGLRQVLAHPGSLAGLNRLRKQSGLAAERLTDLFTRYAASRRDGREIGTPS
ncbi:MAG: putative Adenosylhomocysteine nucleosidase [Nitrospira sp.]